MVRLHTQPRRNIGTGLIYFNSSLDQPGSYQGGVASDDLAKEINLYMDWSVNEMFTLSFILARNNPGPAIEEAFDRTHPFRYAMVFLSFSYESASTPRIRAIGFLLSELLSIPSPSGCACAPMDGRRKVSPPAGRGPVCGIEPI